MNQLRALPAALLLASALSAQSTPLELAATPLRSGTELVVRIGGGRTGEPFALCADALAGSTVFPGGARLELALSPAFAVLATGRFDASGVAFLVLPVPRDPALHRAACHLQALGVASSSGLVRTSPRLDARIEPVNAAFVPAWSSAPARRVVALVHDATQSAAANGARLHTAMQALQPGDALVVGAGRWSLEARVDLGLRGSAGAPIRILVAPGARPVLTRSNASQNLVNVGDWQSARFLVLRGFELTGGSAGLRIYEAEDLWIDGCLVHDLGESGITTNSGDTARVYLTGNEVHSTGGSGEGFYLGANGGLYAMRDSVIARNYVHDTQLGTTQGDGIELKQGSYGNLIAENLVRHTRYPCILVYGTGGRARNRIEGNVCIGSLDVVMQVQGEAYVRNNLLIDGTYGFLSRDHQGVVSQLEVVHNTIVNRGPGAYLRNWGSKPGMVFANNAVYSRDTLAVEFASGSLGVQCAGNVHLGNLLGAPGGFTPGSSLADFQGLSWTASSIDARPSGGSALLDRGAAPFRLPFDLLGQARPAAPDAGCWERL
ncbi:MAG: right-handed parallel beta-helix repeat-containing protein [Planctomycetes bacterium]|nr:right-handed parallel beta-helix repeat-containing protein [Planctomycetota bacterium]